jgi:hypothetical protein
MEHPRRRRRDRGQFYERSVRDCFCARRRSITRTKPMRSIVRPPAAIEGSISGVGGGGGPGVGVAVGVGSTTAAQGVPAATPQLSPGVELTTTASPVHVPPKVSPPVATDPEPLANTQTTEPARVAVAVAVPERVATALAVSWSLAVDVAVPEVSAVAVAELLSSAVDVAVPELVALEVAVLLVPAVTPALDVAVPEVFAVDVAVLPPFAAVAVAVPPPAVEEVQASPLPSVLV